MNTFQLPLGGGRNEGVKPLDRPNYPPFSSSTNSCNICSFGLPCLKTLLVLERKLFSDKIDTPTKMNAEKWDSLLLTFKPPNFLSVGEAQKKSVS